MTNIFSQPILTLFLSFVVTLAGVPLVRRVAFRTDVVDRPSRTDRKKIHASVIPLLGGVAIFVGTAFALLFSADMTAGLRDALLIGTALLVLGIVDDRKPITYKPRLLIQVIAATLMIASLRITPFAYGGQVFAVLISLFWIIGITNAVNLMDNIDGAATGVSCLASASLAVVAFYQGNTPCLFFSLALFGATGAFLLFNYRPASIFLGDAGCLFIGFSLAVVSLMEVMQIRTTIYQYMAFPFFLGLPIFDTTFATIRRLAKGRAVYLADGSNLTYRFLDRGWDRGKIVLVQYSLQILFSVVAFGLLYLGSGTAPFFLLIGLGVPIAVSRYLA